MVYVLFLIKDRAN